MAPVRFHAVVHLGRELAGGHEDQRAGRVARRRQARIRLGRQELQQRQGEARRLARAGLGAAHDVAASEYGRYRLGLYRSRVLVALVGHRPQQLGY
jgi:hypothetical protein